LFKQHVDSVHLGILNVPNNMVLGQNTAAAASTTVVTSPMPSITATLPSVISVTQPSQTFVMASGGQLVATGGHLSPANIMTQGGSVTSAVDRLHKCPKCNVLLPSKNQLTQHKRKVHGKVAMAAGTGGAIPSSHGSVTYAVVSSPQPTFQPPSSVVASLVSQVSQPVSVLAAAAAAAQAAAAASAPTMVSGAPLGVHTSTNITGKKTYSCTACGYSTTRRDGLSQHYDSVHLKIKNHQCELCPYAASQKGTLNRHVKLRHKKKVEVMS